jgi:hypothetical protein
VTPTFEHKWTPLIGKESAIILWRIALIGILDSVVISGSIAAGVLSQKSVVLYPGLSISFVITIALFIQLNTYAKSCSRFFGKHVSMRNLPPSYPDRFNAWCKRNGINPVSDHGK